MEPGGALSSDETRSAVDQPSCDAASEEYSFMAEMKNRPGEIVVADTQFIPGREEPKPLPKGVRLLARQVLKLAIDEQGAVSNCRKVEEEGAYIALDACKYTVPKFGPPLGKDGKPLPTEGTLVVSVYVDRESVT
jgi:hypothetical protein